MRTPGQDDELAVGFLFSEAVIRSREDIAEIARINHARNSDNIISVELRDGLRISALASMRIGTITSSCGICGKESIDAVRQRFAPIVTAHGIRVSLSMLLSLPDRLREEQSEFVHTGGIHAAGIFAVKEELAIVREDIGRHNAVDKAIGRAALDGRLPLDRHVLVVSGRASFEIVQKALSAGIAIVASVSAPSALAVTFCRENNQTLVGFLRPPAFNIYSHVERIILEEGRGSAKHAK